MRQKTRITATHSHARKGMCDTSLVPDESISCIAADLEWGSSFRNQLSRQMELLPHWTNRPHRLSTGLQL